MNCNTNIKILYKSNTSIPKLIYTPETFIHIKNLMNTKHAQSQEFGFMGEIERDGIDYIVTKIHLLPQKTTAAYFETDDDKYPEWLGKNFPTPEERKKLRLQAHSHVNMGTSPSGVDDTQINKMIDNVKDYFIQLIINHRMENTINLYSKEQNLIYTNLQDYVKINNILIPVNKTAEFNFKPYTENLNPEYVKDLNMIYLNDNIFLDCQTLKAYITDGLNQLIYDVANKVFLLTDSAKKDLNKEIDKMITKRITTGYNYNHSYPTPIGLYGDSEEDYMDTNDYLEKYYGKTKGGKKKNEPKQTSRVLQSSKKSK